MLELPVTALRADLHPSGLFDPADDLTAVHV